MALSAGIFYPTIYGEELLRLEACSAGYKAFLRACGEKVKIDYSAGDLCDLPRIEWPIRDLHLTPAGQKMFVKHVETYDMSWFLRRVIGDPGDEEVWDIATNEKHGLTKRREIYCAAIVAALTELQSE